MHAPRSAAVLVAVACLALGLGACTAGGSDGPDAEDVSVVVYQPRPDVAAGRIAIQVHNDSDRQLTVESAELTSSFFADDLVWSSDRDPTVLPAHAVDLRVDLGASDCSEPNPAEHSVTLTFRFEGGAEVTSSYEPTDPYDALPLLHDAACLGERVAEVAELTAASVTTGGGPGAPGTLTITVTPTGVDGAFSVDAVNSTTLLEPAENGIGVSELALGIAVDAEGPTEITIPLVPNRCDPHALAEDKVGTRIPLQVTAPNGTQGRLVLAASDALRAEMYAFYSGYCGLG